MKQLPLAADPAVARALMEHLIQAFEQFADAKAAQSEEGLRYVDALMGCHNFYKAVILDLEERSGDNIGMYRHIAVDARAAPRRRVSSRAGAGAPWGRGPGSR